MGCNDHAVVELMLLRDIMQTKNKIQTLNFRKANFLLLKGLVNKTSWETVLKDKAVEQSWQIIMEAFLQALEVGSQERKARD